MLTYDKNIVKNALYKIHFKANREQHGTPIEKSIIESLKIAINLINILLYLTDYIQNFFNLGFVCPRIIIHSNKSTNQVHQSLKFIAFLLNTALYVSSILMPIIRSLSTTVAASGLPLERGGSSVVGGGRSGPNTTNNTATTTFQR